MMERRVREEWTEEMRRKQVKRVKDERKKLKEEEEG